jgi:hypothetical protein
VVYCVSKAGLWLGEYRFFASYKRTLGITRHFLETVWIPWLLHISSYLLNRLDECDVIA